MLLQQTQRIFSLCPDDAKGWHYVHDPPFRDPSLDLRAAVARTRSHIGAFAPVALSLKHHQWRPVLPPWFRIPPKRIPGGEEKRVLAKT